MALSLHSKYIRGTLPFGFYVYEAASCAAHQFHPRGQKNDRVQSAENRDLVALSNRCERLFTIRAWQSRLAPPTSKMGLLCVTDDVVRGQLRQHRLSRLNASHPHLMSFLTNPVVIGLDVASAIALPIALDDDDDTAIPGGQGLLLDGGSGDGEPAS